MAGLLTTSSVYAVPMQIDAVADAAPPSRAAAGEHRAAMRHGASKAKLRNDWEEALAAKAKYDLPKLLSLMRHCRDRALGMHEMRRARICDVQMFRAGRILGDAQAMVESDDWWKHHGFPAGANETSKVFAAFHDADLDQLVKTVPAFSAEVTGHATTLKYVHRIGIVAGHDGYSVPAAQPISWHRPTVMATINGKPVEVLIDTGTVFPIVIGQTQAAALGATPLLGRLVAPQAAKGGRVPFTGFPTSVIANFKFGGLVMHNVAATIVPDGTIHVPVMVGLPVLARFGRVSLSDTRITAGSAAPRCVSGTPLRFVGGGQLGFSTTANGRLVTAFVDTGNEYPMIAGRRLMPGSASVNAITQKPHDMPKHYFPQLRVRMDSWPLTGVDVPVINRALPYGVDINVGAPLMALADVRIDFSKPSLCVIPKSEVETGAVIVVQDRAADGIIFVLLRMLHHYLTQNPSSAATQGK